MAMVHPSRMGLVPQDPNPSQKRSQSPRRRSRSRSPGRDRERSTRGRDYDSGRDKRYGDRSARSRSRGRDEKGRSDRRDTARSRERDGTRRASPAYEDYRRPEPPTEQAPWRREENMHPDRRGGTSGYRQPGGGGADYMESRRLERESKEVDVWPPSPKAPARDLSPKRKKSSKRHRRARSSSSDSSEDEEDRRRREKKERKRARREKDRSERKEHRRHKSPSRNRSRHHDSEDESEDERDRRHHTRSKSKSRSKSRRLSKTRSPSPSKSPEPSEDEWVPKTASGTMAPPPPPPQERVDANPSVHNYADDAGDMDEDVGPVPIHTPAVSKKIDERAYGGALLRGEGSAMAAFLQEDPSVRIPRRGEIGLTSDEIAQYESVGYVMSGSRHRRMNAVRMRKENQVISAEEKRGILKLQREERARREAILREEFTSLIDDNLKGTDKPKPPS